MWRRFSMHRVARFAACGFASTLIITGEATLAGPTGGGYDLSWFTIDGGGGTSSGGNFTISGTIGQADAGPSGGMSGGPPGSQYALVGGFWPGAAATPSIPCPADFNGSGTVNGLDLAILLGDWSGAATYIPCPPHDVVDLNTDCKVNGLDLAILLGSWGPCP
jgi:Dockerin type I domain